jgi:hypothetical protein
MNYANIYAILIAKATKRIHPFDVDTEQHHILPLAEGGTDDPSNIVYLTVHEHLVAHTLLYKLGFESQILDAQAILLDSLNRHHPRRYRHPKLRFKRWIRRAVARRNAALDRDRARARLASLRRIRKPYWTVEACYAYLFNIRWPAEEW